MRASSYCGLVVLPLLLVSCSTSASQGTAVTPTVVGTSAASETSVTPDVPVVSNPLDITKFVSACSALTRTDLDYFGFSNPQGSDALCTWSSKNTGSGMGIAYATSGLAAIYKKNPSDVASVGSLSGYPAVTYSAASDISKGQCDVAVGVSDTSIVRIDVEIETTSPQYKTPCKAATEVADRAMKNILAKAK